MSIKEVRVLCLAVLVMSIFLFASVLAVEDNTSASPADALKGSSLSNGVSTAVDTSVADNTSDENSAASTSSSSGLSVGAGITPDSAFYFVEDKILSKFRNDLTNREKKIAEIEAMVKEGNIEAAQEALKRYQRYAERAEETINPEKKEEVLRSAAAIRNAIREIENKIPSEDKKEFVDDVLEREKGIETAAEIAAKIKYLCETLSKIDPKKYAQTCKTESDAPRWQRDLDKKLTEEQKKEAGDFEKIMRECMQTEGRQCRCEDISIKPFAEKCSLVAPLATKCDEGDEEACEIMDEATQSMEELLPPHLQEVLAIIEERIRGDQFEHFMPTECRKAGAETRKACMKVMFEKNAPEECAEAVKEGKIDFGSERSMRESCEKIMFLANAPPECIEAGLKDYRKCGTYMCENNLPEECKAAGLTCEQPRNVFRKCEAIMREQGPKGPGTGRGFALGRDCRSIEDKDEKLQCFEEIFNQVQEGSFSGRGPGGGTGFPEECRKAGIDGRNRDDGERCRKLIMSESESRRQQTRDFQENFARECRAKGGAWDCSFGDIDSSNPCKCYVDEHRDFKEFGPPREQFQYPSECQAAGATTRESCERVMRKEFDGPPPSDVDVRPPEQAPSEKQTPLPTAPLQIGGETTSDTTSETTPESTSRGTTTQGSIVTGGVIAVDNKFLDYFFRR